MISQCPTFRMTKIENIMLSFWKMKSSTAVLVRNKNKESMRGSGLVDNKASTLPNEGNLKLGYRISNISYLEFKKKNDSNK